MVGNRLKQSRQLPKRVWRVGLATCPVLRPGVGQTDCKYKSAGPGGVGTQLCISIWTPSKQQNCPSPTKPSPVPSAPGHIWPFGRGSQDGNQTFRMSGCFRTLTLSVCLSFSFLSTPYWKHNFPLSLSSSLLLGNRGPLFIPWAMAWKCQQLGMWDAGQAGTNHRKKAWVGDWLRAETDIQEEDRRRLKWGTLSTPNSRIIKRCVMENHLICRAQGSS